MRCVTHNDTDGSKSSEASRSVPGCRQGASIQVPGVPDETAVPSNSLPTGRIRIANAIIDSADWITEDGL
jgi:hypothetical protein